MTRNELIVQLQQELKGLTSSLEYIDYENAIDASERDCGWSLPQSTNFKEKWLIERAKRHLFFFLMSESAAKFRFKNIHLQHRFDHYTKVIEMLDKSFAEAQNEFAFEFADVSAYAIAGTKMDAGFSYEPQTGRETTYDSNNQTVITPNENS